jgi:hypothetical protein
VANQTSRKRKSSIGDHEGSEALSDIAALEENGKTTPPTIPSVCEPETNTQPLNHHEQKAMGGPDSKYQYMMIRDWDGDNPSHQQGRVFCNPVTILKRGSSPNDETKDCLVIQHSLPSKVPSEQPREQVAKEVWVSDSDDDRSFAQENNIPTAVHVLAEPESISKAPECEEKGASEASETGDSGLVVFFANNHPSDHPTLADISREAHHPHSSVAQTSTQSKGEDCNKDNDVFFADAQSTELQGQTLSGEHVSATQFPGSARSRTALPNLCADRERSRSADFVLDSKPQDPHLAELKKAPRKHSVGCLPRWPPSPVGSQSPHRFYSPSLDHIQKPVWPPVAGRHSPFVLPKFSVTGSPRKVGNSATVPRWPSTHQVFHIGVENDSSSKVPIAHVKSYVLAPQVVDKEEAFNAASKSEALNQEPKFVDVSVETANRPAKFQVREDVRQRHLSRGRCESSEESIGYSSLHASPDHQILQQIRRKFSSKKTDSDKGKAVENGDQEEIDANNNLGHQEGELKPISSLPSTLNVVAGKKNIQFPEEHQDVQRELKRQFEGNVSALSQGEKIPSDTKFAIERGIDLEDQDSGLPFQSSGLNMQSDQSRPLDSSCSSSAGRARCLPSDISAITDCSSSSCNPRLLHSDHSGGMDQSTSSSIPRASGYAGVFAGHSGILDQSLILDPSREENGLNNSTTPGESPIGKDRLQDVSALLDEDKGNLDTSRIITSSTSSNRYRSFCPELDSRVLDQSRIVDTPTSFDHGNLLERSGNKYLNVSHQQDLSLRRSVTKSRESRGLQTTATPVSRSRAFNGSCILDQSRILDSSASSCHPRSMPSDQSGVSDLSSSIPRGPLADQSHSTECSVCVVPPRVLHYTKQQLFSIRAAPLDPAVKVRLEELGIIGKHSVYDHYLFY